MSFRKFLMLAVLAIPLLSFSQDIDSVRIKNHIPELGYAVLRPDSILAINIAGYHRADKQIVSDTCSLNDYFHLGSNTKAITGFIAAMLVEQGIIKWDTKFFSLLPGWKQEVDSAYADITLQDLLSHRAGIQPFTNGLLEKIPHYEGSPSERRKQFAKYVLNRPPVKPANGKSYVYSNAGYTLAALMLETVTYKTWEELVTQVMNEKLNLHITFGWPNATDSTQPWGHWVNNSVLTPLPGNTDYNLDGIEPAGNISMRLPDYAKFIQLNLLGLQGRDTILKAATWRFLHYGLKEYSMGWANYVTPKITVSEHAGSAGTFYVLTHIVGNENIAYIIFANSGNAANGVTQLLLNLKKKYGADEGKK